MLMLYDVNDSKSYTAKKFLVVRSLTGKKIAIDEDQAKCKSSM